MNHFIVLHESLFILFGFFKFHIIKKESIYDTCLIDSIVHFTIATSNKGFKLYNKCSKSELDLFVEIFSCRQIIPLYFKGDYGKRGKQKLKFLIFEESRYRG